MISCSFCYRVFPPEVPSNTYDFDVRLVVHNGLRMRGVFSKRAIASNECSLFIGTYPGLKKSKEENALKISRFASRHSFDELTAIRKLAKYSLSLKRIDPGYILDPTDDEGNLLQEFVPYQGVYLNEPPPGSLAKAAFVYNHPRQRYEIWLLKAVERDEEVFQYYGKTYFRDYPFNAGGCDGKVFYIIPTGSIFAPDTRGIPPPLEVPDLISMAEVCP
jgi:hypothetical protein